MGGFREKKEICILYLTTISLHNALISEVKVYKNNFAVFVYETPYYHDQMRKQHFHIRR